LYVVTGKTPLFTKRDQSRSAKRSSKFFGSGNELTFLRKIPHASLGRLNQVTDGKKCSMIFGKNPDFAEYLFCDKVYYVEIG